MAKKNSIRKLPRFNKWPIGRAAVLFMHGIKSKRVAQLMYERYGEKWKISSPEKMYEYLFIPPTGARPNPKRMFEGKSEEEIRATYAGWLEKARERSNRMRKLNANQEFTKKNRAASSKRMKELWKKPEFVRKKRREMKELWKNPEFAKTKKEMMEKTSKRLWKNKKHAEKMKKLAAKRMKELWKKPEFVRKNRAAVERKLKELLKNPEWNKARGKRISEGLIRHWDKIRKGLLREFRDRGLIRSAGFEEDKKGRLRRTVILASTQTPAREVEQNERKNAISAAIDALGPKERTAVKMIIFDGKTKAETAALLGMNVPQFEALLQGAYQRMAPRVRHLL